MKVSENIIPLGQTHNPLRALLSAGHVDTNIDPLQE
jgi:hypothetical protein